MLGVFGTCLSLEIKVDLRKHEDLVEDLNRPDQADRAAAMEELRRRAALTVRKPVAPDATGFCLNCEAHLHVGQRWCDIHCRDDWQKVQPK